MKTLLIIILAFLFQCTQAIAQDKPEVRIDGPHQFGIHAGATTGLGLAYRYWPKKIGLQFTTVPVFYQGNDYYVSTGLMAMYKLKEAKTYNMFFYYGNHMIFQSNSYIMYDPYPAVTYSEHRTDELVWNTGMGLGFNIHFDSQFSMDLMMGYGLYDISNDIHTMLAGEVGFFYTF
jgi:hypothetical protein